ncbi:hypothetical protein [Cohnella nanjingensis]|uniref:Uncharacterized protein n=1 Tax=Cohnella nanjingensis TaxID=1387779 RepID=A0A7X0VE65_9BACL|nr:hypothetical protein [Cohnella nanjingensis]MBB6669219.1 hypothetical protein [Cohnella nanjingensis]
MPDSKRRGGRSERSGRAKLTEADKAKGWVGQVRSGQGRGEESGFALFVLDGAKLLCR